MHLSSPGASGPPVSGFGKLAVLESKLSIYEDLSKEMLDKLEKAVGTISENSNKIAIILERHENRLDESERTDALIIKMMEEMKAGLESATPELPQRPVREEPRALSEEQQKRKDKELQRMFQLDKIFKEFDKVRKTISS